MCGVQQRVKTDVETGEQSPCYSCGPTTWIAFPTISLDVEDHPLCPECGIPHPPIPNWFQALFGTDRFNEVYRRQIADRLLDRDPDSPERQSWWYDE